MMGFISGMVRLRVEGLNLARFINTAARGGVNLERVQKHSPHSMSVTVSVKDFFRLRPYARAAHCGMRITRKQGLPFVRTAFRRRPVLLLGLLAAALVVWQLSLRVWMVSIEGCARVDTARIEAILDVHGAVRGARASGIDLRAAELSVLESIPEVSWVGMRVSGVRLIVTVNEAEAGPPIIDRDAPYDIIADRDAVIESITVLDGTPRVKPGDAVRPGDVLIEGVAVREGGERRVHALGEVLGRTKVVAAADAALTQQARAPTGSVITVRTVETPLGVFPPQPPVPYEHYDTVIHTLRVSDTFLPVKLHYTYHYEVRTSRRARDAEAAQREAARKSYAAALNMAPDAASVVDKSINFVHIKDGVVTAECTLEMLENIGVEHNIQW